MLRAGMRREVEDPSLFNLQRKSLEAYDFDQVS